MTQNLPKNALNNVKQTSDAVNMLYERIALVIREAKASIVRSVDTVMVVAYWHIGQYIVEEEQGGIKRAGYGKELIKTLSVKLGREFGRGFGKFSISPGSCPPCVCHPRESGDPL